MLSTPLYAFTFFGLFPEDKIEAAETLPFNYTPTAPVGYEKLESTSAKGKNIFDMSGTEEDCTLACSSDKNCSGFEHNPSQNKCWLKTGEFRGALQKSDSSNVYFQHKSANFTPLISSSVEMYYIYDHFDYMKGVDDIANTIKASWKSPEIIFLVHMRYMALIKMDISDIEDILTRISKKYMDNGVPIQFRLESHEQIPYEYIKINDLERLKADYGKFGRNELTIFFGDLSLVGGLGEYPTEGALYESAVYIDNTYDKLLMSGLTMEACLVHELGHWLGLFHPSENDCYPGDYVIDTPPGKNSYRTTQVSYTWISGISSPNTCGYANDQIENIMDYTFYKEKFTPGQAYRMMIFAFHKLMERMPHYSNGIIV